MLTIYKASAGSGKTFQLALHYLKMVLGVKDGNGRWRLNPKLRTDVPSHAHRHILAITFTNKATEEMKTRIIGSLNTVATAADENAHDYIKPLMQTFGCTFEELRTAALHAMTSILIDFSFFNVSTIDSFFQTVLRTFARELGIQGDYNIELDPSDAIRRALNIMLEELSIYGSRKDDPLMFRVHNWLMRKSRQSSSKFNPFKRQSSDYSDMVAMVKRIFSEDFRYLQAEMLDYFDDPSRLDAFRKALENVVERVRPELAAVGNKAETAFNMSGQYDFAPKKTKDMVRSLIEGTVNLDKLSTPITRLLEGVRELGANEYKLNKGVEPSETFIAAMDALAADMRNACAIYSMAKLLLSKIPTLEFISLLIKYIDRVREDENLIILDDTSTYISRIIGGSEIPFIYEHLGSQLQHFLIDEFQDTSRLQWKNLLPLVQNSHAAGDDSLIIGDVKQAIYRFRNSDASILGYDLENIDFRDKENRIVRGVTAEENCNYRTAHGIVRFNNTIMPEFASVALGTDNPQGYVGNEVVQMCAPQRADLSGHIALFPCDMSLGKKDDYVPFPIEGVTDPLLMPVIGDEETKKKVLIEQIRHQHDAEGFAYNDIAVLFRTKSNAEDVVKALLDSGINVQSAESLFLKNAKSVRLLESLLNMLVTAGLPEEAKDGQGSAKEPKPEVQSEVKMEQVIFESRYNFFLYQGGPGGTPLTPQEAINKALDSTTPAQVLIKDEDSEDITLPILLKDAIYSILHKHPATLVATIEAILSAGLIPRSTIKEEKDYISGFTDLAIEYSEMHDNDLIGFLTWWNQRKETATIIPPPDCDAVKILTVHRAKGLEFKCVHLYDFDWKLVDARENVWLDVRPGDNENPNAFQLGIPRELYPPLIFFRPEKSEIGFPGSPLQGFLEKQTDLMKIDALNIAYVALTRAKNSLTIYFDVDTKALEEGKNVSVSTVGNVLSTVLDRIVGEGGTRASSLFLDIPEEAFNRQTKALMLDVPASRVPTQDDKEQNIQKTERNEAEDLSSQDWSQLLNAEYTSTFRADMASIVNVESFEPATKAEEDEEEPELNDIWTPEAVIERRKQLKMEKTQRGLDLHEILSHIKGVDFASDFKDEVVTAIESAAGSEGFNDESREEYFRIIMEMLSSENGKRWFDFRNRIDTELVYHLPPRDADADKDILSVTKRIDRLVELQDGSLEVVDYKFTQVQDIEYNRQVADYVHDLSKIFPGRKITGYLWYYDLGLITPVI